MRRLLVALAGVGAAASAPREAERLLAIVRDAAAAVDAAPTPASEGVFERAARCLEENERFLDTCFRCVQRDDCATCPPPPGCDAASVTRTLGGDAARWYAAGVERPPDPATNPTGRPSPKTFALRVLGSERRQFPRMAHSKLDIESWYFCRVDRPRTGRGAAVAATWIFRRRVAPPWLRR